MWLGWCWQRGEWQPVCSAPTLADCLKLLAVEVKQRGIAGNLKRGLTQGSGSKKKDRETEVLWCSW